MLENFRELEKYLIENMGDIEDFSEEYPRWNSRKDNDEVLLSIEVTGIKTENLSVTINDKNIMTVKAQVEDTPEYQIKGYDVKSFETSFNVTDRYEIDNVIHENGELKITFKRIEPEIKTIDIKTAEEEIKIAA